MSHDMQQNITKTCASCYFHLRNISSICDSLTDEATLQSCNAWKPRRREEGRKGRGGRDGGREIYISDYYDDYILIILALQNEYVKIHW